MSAACFARSFTAVRSSQQLSPLIIARCLHLSSIQQRKVESPRGLIKYEERANDFYEGDFNTKWKLFKEDMVTFKETLKKWDNWKFFLFRRVRNPIKNISFVNLDDEFIIADFSDPESLQKWKLGYDRIWNEGYSTCQLEYNPGGYATFSGYLDSTNLPKDGQVARVGYVNMTTHEVPEFIQSYEGHFDFACWTHLTMKIRGDGRKWMVILGERGEDNQSWDDKHVTWLHTRGGPYWQEVKIPFSKFFFAACGRIQQPQFSLIEEMVKYIGLTLMDGRTGPFRLDIKSIGLCFDPRNQEDFAYEDYYVPEQRYGYID